MTAGPTRDLMRGRVHLGALTATLAAAYGDRPAFEDPAPTPGLHGGGLRTHHDLEHGAARLAAAHAAAGRGRGNRVLLLIGNRVDVLLHAVALARLGAVAVPVNPRLKAAEVAAIAQATSASAAVVDAGIWEALQAEGDVPEVEVTQTGDGRDGDAGVSRPDTAGAVTLASWLRANPMIAREADFDGDPSATAILLATSGTTGLPKAAALTSRGLLGSLGLLSVLPVGRQRGPRAGRDLMFAALPLTHVMGLAAATGALLAGVPFLHRPMFVADEVLDLIEQRRPNIVIGVPTMYADLEAAGAAGRDLRSVQLWGSGADVMPPDRARRFQRHGRALTVAGRGVGTAAFADVWGMVELSGGAAIRLYPPSPAGVLSLPSVAKLLPGFHMRAVDDEGQPLGPARVGHLEIRGPGVLRGYEGRPDAGPDAAGWFATGDLGRVWPGGIFQFAGRTRDRLKVGGFSVFPAEVEEELRGHAGVQEVAVVGLPDDRLGEVPVALVVAGPDGVDPGELLAWAQEHVAGYRRPRHALVVADLPRGHHGKLDRVAATALAAQLLS